MTIPDASPLPEISLPLSVNTLQDLVSSAECRAKEHINWYDKHSNSKARVSQWLRVQALIFGVAGGICPLLPESVIKAFAWIGKDWGYALLAFAGGTLLFDKAFGFSSSWMRFKLVQVKLEAALQLYKLESRFILGAFTANSTPPENNIKRFVIATRQFAETVEVSAVKETEIWVTEFQSALLQAESFIDHARRNGKKPETQV